MTLALLLSWGKPDAALERIIELFAQEPDLPALAVEDAQHFDLPIDVGTSAGPPPTSRHARLQRLSRESLMILVRAPTVAAGLPGSVVYALQQIVAPLAVARRPRGHALRLLVWLDDGLPQTDSPAFHQLHAMAQALGAQGLRFSIDQSTSALARQIRTALSLLSADDDIEAVAVAIEPSPVADRPLIDLSVGELSVPLTARLVHAVALIAGRPSRHAPHGGDPMLRQAILEKERREGMCIDSIEQVLVSSGTSLGFAAALDACCAPGAGILVPDPGFPLYCRSIARSGRRVIPYPASGPDGQPDLDSIARSAPGARAIVWNFPHNPLGTLASEASLAALADIAERFDLVVLSDETLVDFVWRGAHRSPWNGALQQRTIVLRSFSKGAALSGYRIGWMLCPPAWSAPLMKAHWTLTMSTAETAQAAALASLEHWDDMRQRLRAIAATSCEMAIDTLKRHRIAALAPDAGLSLWFKLPARYADDEKFVRDLREAQMLKLRPGSQFGAAGLGHVRLCFGVEPELIDEGLRRFLEFYLRELS